MPECFLPPLEGVLGAAATPTHWQRALRELALPEGLLALAWSLAGQPDLPRERRRDLALVLLAVLVHEAAGSTCLPMDDPEAVAERARSLGEAGLPFEVLDLPALAGFCSEGAGQGPLVRAGDRLSSRRLFEAEGSLEGFITARAVVPRETPVVDAAVLEDPVALSSEQRQAVASALAGRVAFITGGPGTGKTSIIVAILRAALRGGLNPADLALAAPTGKAAHRMAAAIHSARARIAATHPGDDGLLDPAATPQTLHRLLGIFATGDPRHHGGNPLKARLVVVDEASMIDVVMMARLLEALHPEARLVLIGDADQLPSVEAGTAFRDLVAAHPGLTTRLTHSYRMEAAPGSGGLEVLTAARKINGDLPGDLFSEPHSVALRTTLAEIQGLGVELLDPDDAALRAFLDQWLEREVHREGAFLHEVRQPFHLGTTGWRQGDPERLEGLFTALDRVRILCPVREASRLRGTVAINAYLHAKVQEREGLKLQKRLAFALGEPVLMTRNDYARGIFNGDQGLMLLVAREGGDPRLEVVFPTREGFRAFAVGPLLEELELAYAITVHKSQGSEYDRIVLVLPEADTPLATREILYTALTRARRGATLLGSRALVELAAGRGMRRHSRLMANPVQS